MTPEQKKAEQTLRSINHHFVNHNTVLNIPTEFGEVRINNTRIGYCAEYYDYNNQKHVTWHDIPAMAFIQMTERVKEVVSVQ